MRLSPLVLVTAALFAAGGCDDFVSGEGEGEGSPRGPVTYHQDIAPLVQSRCLSCHQVGGIAPDNIALDSYDAMKAQAEVVDTLVQTRVMPPYNVNASGDCQTFRDPRWLGDDEIDLVRAWIDDGFLEGDAPATPPSPPVLDTLDDADALVTMQAPYTPAGDAEHPNDDYRCFIVDPGLPSGDHYITDLEVVPGTPAEVHHILLFALMDDDAEAEMQQRDDDDDTNGGDGFSCFSAPFSDTSVLVLGWAPGKPVHHYPEGTGVFVAGGHKMVMQIHYNMLNGTSADTTAVKFKTTTNVDKEALLTPVADTGLNVPAGEAAASYSFSQDLGFLNLDVDIWGVSPHMHTLGSQLRLELEQDGDTTCMVQVDDWDFHWQEVFLYQDPIRVTGGDTLHMTCTYDTTSRSEAVTWGEGTQDEMCLAFLYLTRADGGAILSNFY